MSAHGSITTAFVLLALAAAPATAQQAQQTAPRGEKAEQKQMKAPAEMSASEFANKVAASDLFEITTSQMALEKASAANVKEFANMMIRDHRASSDKLMTLAKQMKPPIEVTKQLDPMQQKTVMELRNTPAGAAFDRAYLAGQVRGHERTLKLLQGYAADGKVDQLRSFARETAAVVERHLEHARQLQGGASAAR